MRAKDERTLRELHVDIALKDVETVEHDPTRVRRWVGFTREVIDDMF